jgi:membrane fusion protein (multidrug efflux system)
MRTSLAFLLLAALALLSACGGSDGEASSSDSRVPVRVEPVERRDLTHTVILSGRLRANAVVEVQPKLTGRIVAFHKREGDTVRAGELLVELDTTELALELQRASASLAQARARRDEANRKLARAEELHQKNVLSDAALETARAEAAIVDADRKTAVAGRDLARQRLADARITAPIDGILQDRTHSVGDWATPSLGGGATAGASRGGIFTLIQVDPLLLDVYVSEQDVARIRQTDEEVQIQVDSIPGDEFVGVVDYVAPSLDPVSFTQLIRLRLPNPDSRLKPGMFARLEAVRDVAEDALVVPADALVDLGDAFGVYVVDERQQARLRPVQTLFIAGNAAAVASGLSEGDQVIVEGKSSVREGTEVRLVSATPRTGT